MRTRLVFSLSFAAAAAACGGNEGGNADMASPDLAIVRSNLTASEAEAARAACMFTTGTPPGLTLAKDAPLGPDIPIDTIVVLMFENRSFDHLLGHLPDVGVTDVDVAPASTSNLSSAGAPVAWFHDTQYCFCDTNHEWSGSHREWNNGANDGFVTENENEGGCPPDGTRAMSYYTSADLPYFYSLAKTFSVSDRNFCSLLGPTFPNREYLYAATSYGRTVNQIFTDKRLTLFSRLDDASVPWHVYFSSLPGFGVFLDTYTSHLDNTSPLSAFFEDAAAGNLSAVNFVDPNLRDEYGGGDDFHPPGDVQNGEALLKQVVDAILASPQWSRTALFITFDEHGGLYDHVPPPPACPPDAIDPIVQPGDVMAKFDRLGFRVPLIVVSPWAKAHHVSHVVSDHTSIDKFIEARFNLPTLTARDANADPLFDMFDFSGAQLMLPPALTPPSLDQAKLDACKSMFPLSPPVDGGATD
jgi:phospholipase C